MIYFLVCALYFRNHILRLIIFRYLLSFTYFPNANNIFCYIENSLLNLLMHFYCTSIYIVYLNILFIKIKKISLKTIIKLYNYIYIITLIKIELQVSTKIDYKIRTETTQMDRI